MIKKRNVLLHTFRNERVTAKITLRKRIKKQKKQFHREMLLWKGAVYGLYAREDIVHPDGATGVIYKAGEQVLLLQQIRRTASVDGLYLGKYYVKEITPPSRIPGR